MSEGSAIFPCCTSIMLCNCNFVRKCMACAGLVLLGISVYLMYSARSPIMEPYKLAFSSFNAETNTSVSVQTCVANSGTDGLKWVQMTKGYLEDLVDDDDWTQRLYDVQINWPVKLRSYAEEDVESAQVIHVLKCTDLTVPTKLSHFLNVSMSHDVSPAFLIDVSLLSCLSKFSNSSSCRSHWSGSVQEVWFAISNHTKAMFLRKICNVGGSFENQCSIEKNKISIDFQQVTIHVIDLEERPHYWYFPTLPGSNQSHAFLPFEVSVLVVNGASLFVPSDIPSFLSWYKLSRFRECNRTLAATVVPQYKGMKTVITEPQFGRMVYFRDLLYTAGVHPVLFSGTQLGWQRQCDLIPDTTDLDMSLPVEEYWDGLESLIVNDKLLTLLHVLGKPSDSLELSVKSLGMKIDLFFLYSESNYSWVGGMYIPHRKKLKWTYPLPQGLCSADLRGHLFLVFCNFLGFIESNYGPSWYIPFHDAKFVWYNSHKNVQNNGYWSSRDWHSVYRTKF